MKPCKVWIGAITNGYGRRSKRGSSTSLVHRQVWEEANGAVPDGMYVLHRCDNRACYELSHLFLGSKKDNTHDMISKGRQVVAVVTGVHHPCAKLNDAQVAEIRATRWKTRRQQAEEYGVSTHTIDAIRAGRIWKHGSGLLTNGVFTPSSWQG